MYAVQPSFILGFHGCYQSLADRVFEGTERLNPKKNSYDWLGHGIYFWENSPERALKWAEEKLSRASKDVRAREAPGVIGAVIDLGYCLSLFETKGIDAVRSAHASLAAALAAIGKPLPENRSAAGEGDQVLRELDCAVIEALHASRTKDKKLRSFDSVRGPFFEGNRLYTGSGFQEKNHVQICVRNPNCIKGYFRVLTPLEDHPMP